MEELDALDEIFRETRNQPKSNSDTRKDFGNWMPFDEWEFRKHSKMFDEFRSKHGMRPVDSKIRERELNAYLKGLEKQIIFEDI